MDEDLEKGISMTQSKQNRNSNLLDPSPSSISAAALVVTASGKRIDHAGKTKYVKQVRGRHNDTELHLAAQRGDLASVKHILDEVNSQMAGALSGAEVAKIRASMVHEVNESGETALYTAADKGHLEVVKELLKYSDQETLARRSRLEFDPLHIAASQGHHAIVKVLLDHDASLCQTRSQGNATPLITAASNGHTAVVQELLSKDPSLLDIPRSDGKNALHLAARAGHVKTVKCLLEKEPQLALRMDKKGQTALHMALKGASSEVVKLLLSLSDTNVNALTRDQNTALSIAEGLVGHGAVRANELNQPRDELRNTVTQIKNDIHGIAEDVRKLHHEGINNAPNSLTVAVLFATISFAAIFAVPGGEKSDGIAVAINQSSFQIFLIFNAVALYTSLAVVLIQTMLVITGETKAKREVIEVSNKLIWLASVCTSVAFMASVYVVVGRKNEWAAISITVTGGVIMAGMYGTLTYYVVKKRKLSHENITNS